MMNRIFAVIVFLLVAVVAIGQPIARVDKKTKEFTVAGDQKIDYQVYGFQFPNNTTRKMICFSSHEGDVRDNYAGCPLGSYFDTGKLKPGEKILYQGPAGSFAKMVFIAGDGKKTTFYFPKSSFVIK